MCRMSAINVRQLAFIWQIRRCRVMQCLKHVTYDHCVTLWLWHLTFPPSRPVICRASRVQPLCQLFQWPASYPYLSDDAPKLTPSCGSRTSTRSRGLWVRVADSPHCKFPPEHFPSNVEWPWTKYRPPTRAITAVAELLVASTWWKPVWGRTSKRNTCHPYESCPLDNAYECIRCGRLASSTNWRSSDRFGGARPA